jgi:hypothetical protein
MSAFLAEFRGRKEVWAALQRVAGGAKTDSSQIDESNQCNNRKHQKQF